MTAKLLLRPGSEVSLIPALIAIDHSIEVASERGGSVCKHRCLLLWVFECGSRKINIKAKTM